MKGTKRTSPLNIFDIVSRKKTFSRGDNGQPWRTHSSVDNYRTDKTEIQVRKLEWESDFVLKLSLEIRDHSYPRPSLDKSRSMTNSVKSRINKTFTGYIALSRHKCGDNLQYVELRVLNDCSTLPSNLSSTFTNIIGRNLTDPRDILTWGKERSY